MSNRQEDDTANTDPKPQKLTSKMFLVRIKGKGQMGPITAAALRTLANSGNLGSEDLVSIEATENWCEAKDVKGLFTNDTRNSQSYPVAKSQRANGAIRITNTPENHSVQSQASTGRVRIVVACVVLLIAFTISVVWVIPWKISDPSPTHAQRNTADQAIPDSTIKTTPEQHNSASDVQPKDLLNSNRFPDIASSVPLTRKALAKLVVYTNPMGAEDWIWAECVDDWYKLDEFKKHDIRRSVTATTNAYSDFFILSTVELGEYDFESKSFSLKGLVPSLAASAGFAPGGAYDGVQGSRLGIMYDNLTLNLLPPDSTKILVDSLTKRPRTDHEEFMNSIVSSESWYADQFESQDKFQLCRTPPFTLRGEGYLNIRNLNKNSELGDTGDDVMWRIDGFTLSVDSEADARRLRQGATISKTISPTQKEQFFGNIVESLEQMAEKPGNKLLAITVVRCRVPTDSDQPPRGLKWARSDQFKHFQNVRGHIVSITLFAADDASVILRYKPGI